MLTAEPLCGLYHASDVCRRRSYQAPDSGRRGRPRCRTQYGVGATPLSGTGTNAIAARRARLLHGTQADLRGRRCATPRRRSRALFGQRSSRRRSSLRLELPVPIPQARLPMLHQSGSERGKDHGAAGIARFGLPGPQLCKAYLQTSRQLSSIASQDPSGDSRGVFFRKPAVLREEDVGLL